MSKGIVQKALESISYYLTVEEKRYAIFLFVLLIFSSILDVFGLASLVPLIMAASTPELITKNRYLAPVYHFFNFPNEKIFLLALIICVFLFFLFKNLFTTWINYKQVRFTAGVALIIIQRQFNKYLNLPFWDFNNIGSAKLINNVLNLPQGYVSGIIRPIFNFFAEVAIIIVIILGILIYEPLLFIILLLVLAPSAIGTYQMLKNRSEIIGRNINQLRPPSLRIISNTFNGFVELKLADKIFEFRNRFFQNQKKVQSLEAKSYLFSQIPLKIIEMVAILGVLTIFLYTIFISNSPERLITIVGLFAAAAYRLMPSVNRLLTALVLLKQNSYIINELQLFKEHEGHAKYQLKYEPVEFKQHIYFKNVTFSFPDSLTPTIKNVNFKISKGEKVGFIGSSGSGKTTLMNILLRFYIEQQGQVLIDGKPLTETNKLAWYSLIGYVKQDTFLMESSIKDNITLFDTEVDPIKFKYALEQASLNELVRSLPNKENTLVGEGGFNLSGGQKQRIGIARALYRNSQVLILDEATSALDSLTERDVSEAIDKLSQTDMTIFIIAHRITTLRDCNRIFELANGEIIAERTYAEVLKNVI
ncbi:ABC transporter ATP-binding protein [Adhaeribacter rhizoryzae]|uniref:ABC transporter ATP-binding protein n=1 Tax=Adhaeribacter rhizoryzae TaxID=2607907 RepID=A0A5M6DQ72_9BACT|nr:ABC transporter ATP-binding protein [Adhaeribacter rhizoryzae]KAA5548330.1 ABC transporter ATP-binding protein [Adhaeribacter rhizoryzae]